jgi:signal transduction histidine kinase
VGRKHAGFYLSLLAGALALGLSLMGFSGLFGRSDIPWDELAQETGIPAELLPGSAVRVDGFAIRDLEFDFKFIVSRHRIGDVVDFVFLEDGHEHVARAALVPYYFNRRLPLIYFLTGFVGFVIGFAVFIRRRGDPLARLFYWLCLAFSSAVVISGAWYGLQGRPLHLVPGAFFYVCYALTPVILLKFTLCLTDRERLPGAPFLWGAGAFFGVFFAAVLVVASLAPSIRVFRLMAYFWVFRLFFVVLSGLALFVLFQSYRAARTREARDQVRWVFYGIVAGLGPFMFFYQLPRALGLEGFLGEDAASAFFVLLPLALALAILRYKLMDLHVIVNKSVVYSLLTVVIVGVYMLSIEGLKRLAAPSTGTGRKWLSTAAAFIAALAFAPARAWIQTVVDKAFFRRGYDFRRTVRDFTAAAERAFSAEDLLDLFSDALARALPVERFAAFVPAPADARVGSAVRRGIDGEAVGALPAGPAGPAASAAPPALTRLGFETALPVAAGDRDRPGWVLLGRKRSGLELTEEDRSLLETLAEELGAALRRVRLREEVVYERATREKLEELGRLKTEFISAVSHEIRTPMTSLRSISELLKSDRIADPARREKLLELMAGECGRLGRYLSNVLDFGRIEQDAKSYDLRETDLGPIVADAVEMARSGAGETGLDLAADLPAEPVRVRADGDAVRQALHNLLDNAVKYGGEPKRIRVRLARVEGGAEIAVGDNGIGLAAADRDRVFEAFYRAPEAVRRDPKGVGLGLMIVKHIMDAHGGSVDIASEPGRGATFTLRFPERGPA